jgi:Fe-S-cluster-containing dehydrogenase component
VTLLSSVEPVEATPIDLYIQAQADLTPVERFAQRHSADVLPAHARLYTDVLPGPGQQLAFSVDLAACTGCKACVTACHSLNGLDEGETWRRVTLDGTQHVTAACHHCVDPACLKGCPVDAYEKDPVTGIVVHLDDQCIGCSYCTLTCPYDVPVYSKSRGIVRKCDMCRGRLAEGESPACVQGCPNEAISIAIVDVASVAPVLTRPTTTYSGSSPLEVRAPGRPHTPLAVMLVLTQLAVGAFIAGGTPLAIPAGVLALGASVFHLGRPQYAYRAVIGLRHSWLSREVVAFGAFTGLAVPAARWPGLYLPTAAAGLVGVWCSVMIYAVTGRWRPARIVASFTRTTAVGALAALFWPIALVAVPLELRARMRFFTEC